MNDSSIEKITKTMAPQKIKSGRILENFRYLAV
jgi:hypothetical protein